MELNDKSILKNVENLYYNSLPHQKPSVLSLVACSYSFITLNEVGFNISRDQFNRARKINQEGKATLIPYVRAVPVSKSKLSK